LITHKTSLIYPSLPISLGKYLLPYLDGVDIFPDLGVVVARIASIEEYQDGQGYAHSFAQPE
jgi:hypothetical protein